jgi:serine/threonine-protein kinase
VPDVDLRDWAALSPLLDELLELEPAARAARLATLRERDAAMAAALDTLLAEEDAVAAEGFLEGHAIDANADADAALAGRTFGAYTLERPLGAGGMGSVWLGHRSDGRYTAAVAVKLLNLALLGRGGAARFAREGQALARLSHPHIARLLDAGVADGQPYLVLEHVDGAPIDKWCDEHRVDVSGRLRLMLDVLDAVAHAHSKLVLHRDVKPANILVTPAGEVKLLDFGIAKLLDGTTAQAAPTELTQVAGRAFTPDYAAPEQVQGGDVTTATDVYALGVLLYLLLAGVHPTSRTAATAMERLRSVVESEPTRLSEAAARAEEQTGVAGAGGIAAARRDRSLRGDLDNICAKALKKAPEERYATAAAFADDLRRHLAHEPVSARPDTFAYRTAKFVRRHRLGVAAAAALVATLVAGIVGTAWQAVEAQRQRAAAVVQRDRAQQLLGRNEAIAEFVNLMFGEAVPEGQAKAVQAMLERSEPLIATEFAGEPAQQAEALRVLASYYTALNLPKKQFDLIERARGIVERVPDPSLKARLDCDQAEAAFVLGRNDDAVKLIRRWSESTDIEAAVAATCLDVWSRIAQAAADAEGALGHAQRGLERLRAAGESAPRIEARLFGDMAFAQHLAGRNAEADRAYGLALDRVNGMGRPDSYDALRLSLDRGVVRYAMSDYRGGLELFDHVLRVTERQGGAVVPPGVLANRAFGLEQLARYDEALEGYARTLETSRRNGFTAGEAYALVGRASVLEAKGQLDDAQAALTEAERALVSLPPAHASRTRHALTQGRVDLARGDLDAAEKRFSTVIDLLTSQKATTPPLVSAYRGRAEVGVRRGDAVHALADAQAAVDLAKRLQGSNPHSELTGLASLTLARALRASGDTERSAQVLATAQAELLQTVGAEHPETRAATALLAQR